MRARYLLVGVVLGVLLTSAVVVLAGSVDPPSGPTDAASQMVTLEQIYERLDTGAAGTKMTSFSEPASGPGAGTMHTLDDVMAVAPAVDDTAGAAPGEVLSGKTFWGLRSDGTWGPQTGTVAAGANVTGPDGAKTFAIPDGFYAGKTVTASDSDLLPGNIRQGANILGVPGTYPLAPVRGSGQLYCYTTGGAPCECGAMGCPPGQDKELEVGVDWPNPRFTVNVDGNGDGDCDDPGETCDGTVTDNLTGLIWLRKVSCLQEDWETALASASALYDGWTNDGLGGDCELADGSNPGDWRLPSIQELQSLLSYGWDDFAVPNIEGTGKWITDGYPFKGISSAWWHCWSSTSYARDAEHAWYIDFKYGELLHEDTKAISKNVWAVRGGP